MINLRNFFVGFSFSRIFTYMCRIVHKVLLKRGVTIMRFETENIEFKRQFTDEIYKEVIAFANTDGGIVYE